MEGESSTKKKKRDRSSSLSQEKSAGNEETEARFGMLYDIDLLNCPICFEGFTTPIFQCDNGHLACSSCCTKLKNKCCPSCTLPIGTIRCRAVEKMVESIVFHCPNFKHGCEEILSNEDHKTHEQKCRFLQCSCPLLECNYKGTYKDLFQHFGATHKDYWTHSCLYNNPITFGKPCFVSMYISEHMSVLMETTESLLFVVQYFRNLDFVSVVVKCIAPLSDEVGEFSYSVSFGYEEVTLKSGFSTMKKVKEVNFETPDADFMMFPSYLLFRIQGKLKVTVVIKKKKKM